ncbi:NAD(+) synthase [Candidatus Woesearchaeota archaeon]|nr:NAD(+) synthase [Candidatus Woesearchaeota archaeon]
MKLALAQINPFTRDLAGNTKKIIDFIRKAKSQGADIVAFPELAITGYCMADNFNRMFFIRENKRLLQEVIAPEAKGIIVVVGFVDYDEAKTMRNGKKVKWNAAAVIQDGKIVQIRRKSLLPNYDVFDDWRYFKAGTEEGVKPVEISIKGKKIKLGILVCEELWEDDYQIKPVKLMKKNGAELIISISASPSYFSRIEKRIEICKKRIQENNLPVVYLNTVGIGDIGKNIIPFDGFSMVFDKEGRLLDHAALFEEDLKIVDLEKQPITLPPLNEWHLRQKPVLPIFNRWKLMYDQLVMSVKDYFQKLGFKKAVIGLSGGIDSALVACIAVDAIGKENVLAVNMPSRFNATLTKDAARDLAKNLGIKYLVWPIEDITNIHRKSFKELFKRELTGVSDQNPQARLRGNVLMTVSNAEGHIVLSTGNKTEVALGYCTLYGDMVGGLDVLGDINKIEVYKLSDYVNQKAGKEIIPEASIKVKASAELGADQDVTKGQGDPFDYFIVGPLVDEIVNNDEFWVEELVQKFKNKEFDKEIWIPDQEGKTVYDKFTPETFRKFILEMARKIDIAAYKRMQAAPIIRASPNAFGWDYREVIVKK